MKKVICILHLFLISLTYVQAQVTFEKTFTFWDYSAITGVLPLSDGYILCGNEVQFNGTDTNYYHNFIIKIDLYGDTVFVKTYKTIKGVIWNHPLLIPNGNAGFYLAFHDSSGNYLQKLNIEGDIIWTKPLPTGALLDFIKSSDGNFVFICDMDCCFQISKINPEVDLIWTNLINATDTTYSSKRGAFETDTTFNWPSSIKSIIEVQDGHYKVAVNYSSNYSEHSTSQFLFTIDSEGQYIGKKKIASSMPWPRIHKLINCDSDMIVLGSNDSEIFYISRLDHFGDTVWTRHYLEGIRWGYFNAITKTSEGNFVMAGVFMEQQNQNVGLLSFSPQGDYLWHRQYAGGHLPIAGCVVSCSDGGIAAGGNIGGWDEEIAYFIKTDANGHISEPGIFENDPVSHLNLFPNPASGFVNLEIQPDYQSIEIFDLSGRLVYSRELANTHENEISFMVDKFIPGIYLVKVFTGESVFADKLVIICRP
jgi:hypothetical protein